MLVDYWSDLALMDTGSHTGSVGCSTGLSGLLYQGDFGCSIGLSGKVVDSSGLVRLGD